jgi:predicted DNA-binding transcriptional regulator YafY
MKIDRLLSIVIMLLNREKISAAELAKKFEVSVRTIYRDVDTINISGIPVISYPGNNGGIGIMPNYKLDKQLLTLNDMVSILTALKGINATLEDKELDNAIEKITNLVPEDHSDFIFNNIIFDIKPWGKSKNQSDKMKILYNSIVNLKTVKFEYVDRNENTTTRIVEPVCLVYKGYSWYLIAFCRNKNDFRTFRFSGIKKLEVWNENFLKRTFNYKDYAKESSENLEYIKLILKFSPKVKNLIEDYIEYENPVICENGFLQIEMNVPNGDWLNAMLLSYGDNVEIIEPASIRELIKNKAKNILKIYET